MRKTIKAEKYIIDQLIQLVFFSVVALGFYHATSDIVGVMCIIETLLVCSCSYLLRHILVFPLDLLCGYVEKDVCFSQLCNIDEYEFFRKKYFCEWNFYFSSKETLTLLVPVCQTHEEILQMDRPVTNQKVKIRYYRYSKILYSWECL